MNTWVASIVRYSRPFLKWSIEEFQQMDRRTRKLMTMHKAEHPRDDVGRLYASREGGRGLTSIQNDVDASIRQLEDYIKKRRGRQMTRTRNNTDNTSINWTKITRKQKWKENQLYRHFKRQTSKISHEKTWKWIRKGNLKKEVEFLLVWHDWVGKVIHLELFNSIWPCKQIVYAQAGICPGKFCGILRCKQII